MQDKTTADVLAMSKEELTNWILTDFTQEEKQMILNVLKALKAN